LPITLLFLIIKYWKKGNRVSIGLKILLGIIFSILGLAATYVATIVSISGHIDKGLQCASGVVVFIPIGLFINIIGIPLMLFLEENIRGKKRKLCHT
jgi:hypothetical protein